MNRGVGVGVRLKVIHHHTTNQPAAPFVVFDFGISLGFGSIGIWDFRISKNRHITKLLQINDYFIIITWLFGL
jgi:hypothetical protein